MYNKIEKINELEAEMKTLNLWQKEPPQWVNHFEDKIVFDTNGFVLWLQYVFIPNHLQKENFYTSNIEQVLIVPTAFKIFGNDVCKGKLLRILIELDALI